MLQAIERKSLSDAVFEQLRARIVAGALPAGETLPSERALCETLQVNRGALREALKRLEQAGLVEIRHGGATRVRDFRAAAGPELLTALLVREDGTLDARVAAGVLEVRMAVAPDIARLAARRGREAAGDLRGLVAEMEAADGDLAALQDASIRFWERLVRAADNVAYRLLYNALQATYDQIRGEMRAALSAELRNVAEYRAMAEAVDAGDERASEAAARRLLGRNTEDLLAALEALRGKETHR